MFQLLHIFPIAFCSNLKLERRGGTHWSVHINRIS